MLIPTMDVPCRRRNVPLLYVEIVLALGSAVTVLCLARGF